MATDKFTVTLMGVFAAESITDKADLDRWCEAEGRDRLYDSVKRLAPTEWATDPHPEERVRWTYQRLLTGFSISEKAAAKAAAKAEARAALEARKEAEKAAKLYARAEKAAAKILAAATKAEAKEAAKAAAVAAKAAKAEAKAAAKLLATAAKAEAKEAAAEVAEPTPYDGVHIVNGILYMVDEETSNVFAYDAATETVGDRMGLWRDGSIEYDLEEPVTPPGTVAATVIPEPVPSAAATAPVAQAKTAASAVKRAAIKEAKAVILRAQIARLEEQLARRQSELAALSG